MNEQVFDHPVSGHEAARRLLELRQGHKPAADCAIEFRTLASESKWDSEALLSTFYHGLSEEIKDELASRDWGSDLKQLITLAIRFDNRICKKKKGMQRSSSHTHGLAPQVPLRAFSPTIKLRNRCNWAGNAYH